MNRFTRRCRVIFLLLVLPAGAGCSGFGLLDAMVASRNDKAVLNLPYGSQPRQKLDVYQPRSAPKPAGVVIFIYGGAWRNGDKANYRFVAEALTAKGFVVVLPDYRLYPAVRFPAFVQDAAQSVRWVRDNITGFGGDPDHIYLMGHSAGAHIAALLTLDAHYLQAVGLDRGIIRATAALSGPYDFMPWHQDREIFNMAPSDKAPDPRIEPVNFVDGKQPPMLLLHGRRDAVVGVDEADRLFDRIAQIGGEARYTVYTRGGHESVVLALAAPFQGIAPVLHDVTQFFRDH